MTNKKAFTLIELLIVITIIGILSAVTLQLNRWQINDMEAMNDREQRLSRHRTQNNILTNTNFINWQKISTGIQFIYSGWATSITQNISWTLITYPLKNHTISGNLTIIKQPLSLWCTVTSPNIIELVWPNKTTCFTLNTHLCSRENCK